VSVPDGRPDFPVVLRSDGKGRVIFRNDGRGPILRPGSYNTVDGIEFHMVSESPRGSGIDVERKEHITIRNCRCFACQIGVDASGARHLSISNCEMAYSGQIGIHLRGSGDGPKGHRNPADQNRHIEVRNCYLHDAGWNVDGTEGYGLNVYGAAED